MGFLDDAKDKATEFAGDHPDQVSEGLDKAGDFADDKTGGKYGDQIDKGTDMAKDQLGIGGEDAGEGGQDGPEARGEGRHGGGGGGEGKHREGGGN